MGNHYGEALQAARTELLESSQVLWGEAWQVATWWAHKNLKSIQESTIKLTTTAVMRLMVGEALEREASLMNPQSVVREASQPLEVRVVHLHSGPLSSSIVGKIWVEQGEGAQEAVVPVQNLPVVPVVCLKDPEQARYPEASSQPR